MVMVPNRNALINKIDERKRDHKATSVEQRLLVHETCRQIIEECEKAELVNRTAYALETSVDDLIKQHGEAPAYVERNYEQLHRAHTRLSFLLSVMAKFQAAAE